MGFLLHVDPFLAYVTHTARTFFFFIGNRTSLKKERRTNKRKRRIKYKKIEQGDTSILQKECWDHKNGTDDKCGGILLCFINLLV